MKNLFIIIASAFLAQNLCAQNFEINPPRYTCYKTTSAVMIDGVIDEKEWGNAPWSSEFQDIRGGDWTKPKFQTRMKLMWDEQNLYIAAELIEPHLWATLRQRDTTIFLDNDFEVFIDPTGNTHNYYEFEINAFGTEWDLLMTKPYRYGGTYMSGFDFKGMRSAVKHYGTINDPRDTDEKWTLEIVIPFSAMKNKSVKAGEQWRMNFSRVAWLKYDITDGGYRKTKGKEGFSNEENWVWAPTGVVDIHIPEHWGYVQFTDKKSGNPEADFIWNKAEDTKIVLRKYLYLQRDFHKTNGRFANNLTELKTKPIDGITPIFYPAGDFIKITANGWSITSDSRVWNGN